MRKNDFSKIIKLSVVFVLIAAMALCMFSCGGNKAPEEESETKIQTENGTEKESPDDAKYSFTLNVIDDKGNSKKFNIKTNCDNLGDALLEAKLVEGEDGPYGLYIKVVDGLRADYELDGAYWSLSKNGEMLLTGVSETKISNGEKYELTYTK